MDKRERSKDLYIDEGAAAGYVDAAIRLSSLFPQLPNDFTLCALMRSADVLRQEETPGEDEELFGALKSALAAALGKSQPYARKEGGKLAADMLSRMDKIEKLVEEIAARAPLVAENYRAKMSERIREVLEGVEIDEGRILAEVAVFADKSNIDEELTRLRSHIAQFRSICREERGGQKTGFPRAGIQPRGEHHLFQEQRYRRHQRRPRSQKRDRKVREQVQNVE